MAGEQNGHDPTRLDRIEGMIEVLVNEHMRLVNEHIEFEREHRQLLTAQVILTDRVDRNAQQIAALLEAQERTDDRLNALITTVDNMIRNPPRS